MKKITIGGIVLIALGLAGCSKPPEAPTPPAQTTLAPAPAPSPTPESSATAGSEEPSESASGAEEEVWKKVWGPDDAPVKVEAFYVFNEDHQWVQDYAKEISEKYPTQVQVIAYDFYTRKGGELWEERGLRCGAWMIDGKIAETKEGTQLMKSETAGGWKKAQLLEVVAEAVAKAEGSAKDKTAAPEGGAPGDSSEEKTPQGE